MVFIEGSNMIERLFQKVQYKTLEQLNSQEVWLIYNNL